MRRLRRNTITQQVGELLFCRCAHSIRKAENTSTRDSSAHHSDIGTHKRLGVRSIFGCDAGAVYVCCHWPFDVDGWRGNVMLRRLRSCTMQKLSTRFYVSASDGSGEMRIQTAAQTPTSSRIHSTHNPREWMMRTWTFGRHWSIRMKHVQSALHAIASVRVLRCSNVYFALNANRMNVFAASAIWQYDGGTYLPTNTYSTHNNLLDRYFMNIAWTAAFPLFYYTHFSEIEKWNER